MMRCALAILLTLMLLLSGATPAVAAGACAIYKTFTTGDTFTADDATQLQITSTQTNMVWSCLDDYSSNTTQMGSTVDPYPSSVASLATTGQGELERLRYVIKALTGWSQWYAHTETPTFSGTAPSSAKYVVRTANATLTAESDLGLLTTGLLLNTVAAAEGTLSAYAGTSCTNQFPRSLNASGAATCASVSLTADITGTLPVANGGTNLTAAADDEVMVGNGTTWQSKALTNCTGSTSAVQYATASNAFSCGTITAGVALGDSPTWTGTHTWSSTAARIIMSNTDNQILLGTSTDPGWSVPAVQMRGTSPGAVYASADGDLNIAINSYYDGQNKYVTTAAAFAMYFDNLGNGFALRTAPSGTAGTAITWTAQLSVGPDTDPGVSMGAPTGGFNGAGVLNVDTAVQLDGNAYANPHYVLEHAFTGQIVRFADRDGAATYQGLRPLQDVMDYARIHYELPLMDEAKKRHGDIFDIFRGGDALLATVEEAYLYLSQHETILNALRARIERLERLGRLQSQGATR